MVNGGFGVFTAGRIGERATKERRFQSELGLRREGLGLQERGLGLQERGVNIQEGQFEASQEARTQEIQNRLFENQLQLLGKLQSLNTQLPQGADRGQISEGISSLVSGIQQTGAALGMDEATLRAQILTAGQQAQEEFTLGPGDIRFRGAEPLAANIPSPEAASPEGKAALDRIAFVEGFGEDSDVVRFFDEQFAPEGAKLSDVSSLRGQFIQGSSSFAKALSGFRKVVAAAESPDPTGASDLALIFNFMKVLDPESVVRESEFATAQNSGGVPERIRQTYNRAIGGERLTEQLRIEFLQAAEEQFMAVLGIQRQREDLFRGIAERSEITPEDVVIDLVGDDIRRIIEPPEPVPGNLPPGTQKVGTDQNGNPVFLTPEGRTVDAQGNSVG